jgi:hypothetical protein
MQKTIIIVKANNMAKKIDKLHESAKRISKGGIPRELITMQFHSTSFLITEACIKVVYIKR